MSELSYSYVTGKYSPHDSAEQLDTKAIKSSRSSGGSKLAASLAFRWRMLHGARKLLQTKSYSDTLSEARSCLRFATMLV